MTKEYTSGGNGSPENKFLAGLTPLPEFADAIGKHPKTVMRLNPPLVYVGRTAYVPDEQGRAWILNGCRPLPSDGRSRQRRDFQK